MTTQDPINTHPENIEETLEAIIHESGDTSRTQQIDPTDEIQRLRDSLARSQADYQNLLMRVDRDKADMV